MDEIFSGFIEEQNAKAEALNARSPLVDIQKHGAADEASWILDYSCRGLIRRPDGAIVEANRFKVGVRMPPDYLRCANPYVVVTWLGPRSTWHPNVGPPPGSDQIFICTGHLRPGTPLVDIVIQVFEIITYQLVTMREDDALNHAACRWARANQHLFPIDRRSLLGRVVFPEPAARIGEEARA